MKILLLCAGLMASATSLHAEDALITIRGLNVESTPGEIEEALGTCREDDGFVQCGTDGYAGYVLNDDGQIEGVALPCSYIKGCQYNRKGLMERLAEGLSLQATPDHGEFMSIVDGPAGDLIIVAPMDEDKLTIMISEGSYRSEPLLLE